jgi:hypothetical protein
MRRFGPPTVAAQGGAGPLYKGLADLHSQSADD